MLFAYFVHVGKIYEVHNIHESRPCSDKHNEGKRRRLFYPSSQLKCVHIYIFLFTFKRVSNKLSFDSQFSRMFSLVRDTKSSIEVHLFYPWISNYFQKFRSLYSFSFLLAIPFKLKFKVSSSAIVKDGLFTIRSSQIYLSASSSNNDLWSPL